MIVCPLQGVDAEGDGGAEDADKVRDNDSPGVQHEPIASARLPQQCKQQGLLIRTDFLQNIGFKIFSYLLKHLLNR